MSRDPGRLVRPIPAAARGLAARRRAWARTLYRAGEAEGRVGQRSPSLEAVLARWGRREGGFVTACNPWGRPVGAAINAMLQRRLEAEARGLPQAVGDCGAGGWVERTLFLAVPPARLAALARRYRQAAVVRVRVGRKLRLAYWPRFHLAPRGR